MSAASAIDPTGVERLRKIWALASSPNAGEAAAARDRAAVFLARLGKTIADIPDLLAAKAKTPGPSPGPAGFTFYDMNNPDHVAAWAESDRRHRAERARKEAPEREAVLSRYSSMDAAIAPCEREVLLRMSVRKWAIYRDWPNQRWIDSIDGYNPLSLHYDMPPHVKEALSAAYPLPVTIGEAKSEYDYWERRDRELGLILEDTSNTQLDVSAYGRQEIVRGLLETGLRAQSLADVLIRQRYLVDSESVMVEVEQAVLADLEHLAAMAELAPKSAVQNGHVHNGQRETATARRAEVIRLLSNVDTARLSDREIARMVGVSPQTVGNIRRKHEASMPA